MVAYKVVIGNLSVTPLMGKVNEGELGAEDDVDDYIVHVQYDNPESELSLGFIYDVRQVLGNDAPAGYFGAGFSRTGSFSNNLMGFFLSQKALSWLRTSVEADILSGDTGIVNTATQAKTSLNAFGVAAEFAYLPSAESKWGANVKFGLATGDDPGTTDVYEGFAFSRNYDVGMLMFNHPLGRADFMRTGMIRDVQTKASNQIDTEAISNVLYFAPSMQYRMKENLSFGGTFVYGMLNKDPIGGGADTAKNLGFELDLNVTYKPMERLTWITEAGFLLPGDAWKGGTSAFENKFAYGVISKAAISF